MKAPISPVILFPFHTIKKDAVQQKCHSLNNSQDLKQFGGALFQLYIVYKPQSIFSLLFNIFPYKTLFEAGYQNFG